MESLRITWRHTTAHPTGIGSNAGEMGAVTAEQCGRLFCHMLDLVDPGDRLAIVVEPWR